MDFRQLRYFLAVAGQGNFRRAAETINIAQSALSRHVADLEARLGVQLFERLPGGVRLTRAGRIFAEEAGRALELAERAGVRAQKAAIGEIDRLTIAVNEIGARNEILAKGVMDFARRYPEVQLDFVMMPSHEQVAAIGYGRVDAGVMIERGQHDPLDFLPVARDPFWLAMPKGHRLADFDLVPVAELIGEDFVSVDRSAYFLTQSRLLAGCLALGFSPRVILAAANDNMQMNLVAAGLGLGLVNRSVSARMPATLELRPVEGLDVAAEIDLVWPVGRQSASLRNLADALSQARGPLPIPAP